MNNEETLFFHYSDFFSDRIKMCEASQHYLWDLGDKVGSGATSNVYKAYNIETGEIVAAKVSKIGPVRSTIQPTHGRGAERNPNSSSVFDREVNFLRDANHDNIVRFIGTEVVTSTNDLYAIPNRDVLFIEYCNGGSVGDMLRLPANRYGLPEDMIMQIMKDVINALKYLHMRNILHRDIKPDNILQSIDINGKTTYKLTDLGVARQINPDEEASYSMRGTEEYVHPLVYFEVFPEKKVNVGGNTVAIRVQFLFEVEMWSFGVTIYQCSTGRIPFQPFEGTRNDRSTMREILRTIPMGCISGIQLTNNGEIQWSKGLPGWCRLSLTLKDMLEKLLSRLFETNQERLMKHTEFFHQIDQILDLIPIYYLNLKKLTLTCTYLPADHSINKLFDQIRKENNDEINVDYYCLFQNVHYPISKNERISIKTFYEQLPVQPSREKPLVIYTFSSLQFDQKSVPKVDIPEIQPMNNIQDRFRSVFDWSKAMTGLFFYLKNQLVEYEYIMKIIQSSITTIHRFLKSKLLKLHCSIRSELSNHRALHELERIVNLIEGKNNSTSEVNQLSTGNNEQSSIKTIRIYHKSIVKPFQIDETVSQQTTVSEQQITSHIRPILQSSINFYHKLVQYDEELSAISNQHFNDELKVIDERQAMFNTSYLSKEINNYSLHIQQIDTYVNNAIDLSERFRRDTMINRSSSLQMTSHILRQKLLQELHDQLIHFIHAECYSLISKIFNGYKKLIKQQADVNFDLQRIRSSYEDQAKTNIPIDDLRQIITNELQKLGTIKNSSLPDQPTIIHPENIQEIPRDQQRKNVNVDENVSHLSKNAVHGISVTMQQTIEQAESNANMLNHMIEQLQQQIRHQTIN